MVVAARVQGTANQIAGLESEAAENTKLTGDAKTKVSNYLY